MNNTRSPLALRPRFEVPARLALVAERTGRTLTEQVGGALAEGDLARARTALADSELRLKEIAENLRVHQMELQAQADELAEAQARTEQLLERFSTVFGHLPVAAMVVGPQGDLVEHNARAEALFGLRGRSAAGHFLHRLAAPEAFQDLVRPAMHRARAAGQATLPAVDFVGADGRAFVGELHVAWLTADAEAPAAADGCHVCVVLDRSEALQALAALRAGEVAVRASEALQALESLRASEAAVREREALLAETASLARIGGWALTLGPEQVWAATDQLRELLDLAPDEGLSLSLLLSCCNRADRPRLREALQGAAEGRAFALELDMVTPSGRTLRVRVSGQPAYGADFVEGVGGAGAVERVVGLLQDISRSHDDQRLIGELTDRLAVVNDAGGVGVWDWDLLRDEVAVDARMAQLLGLPGAGPLPAPQLRATLDGRLLPGEAERLDVALLGVVERGGVVSLELRLAAPADPLGSDEESWLHMTGRAHIDADGRVRRIVGCAWHHRTHYRAARQEVLRETARLAEHTGLDFLARMSDELRAPLNAIVGFSQLMRLEAEAGDLAIKPQRLDLIDAAARTLWQLVDEVQDLARAESGLTAVQREPLDLHRLLTEAQAAVGTAAGAAGVVLADEISAWPPLAARGDAQRLHEVLVRLLTHALQRSPQGGRVRLQAGLRAGEVWVTVTDAGAPMRPAQIARLFHPFAHRAADSGIPRDSMSLFLSRRFAELMGGRLDAEQPAGSGLRLSLVLPQG